MKLESSNPDFTTYRMTGRAADGRLYFRDYYINAKISRVDQAMFLKLARHRFKRFLSEGLQK